MSEDQKTKGGHDLNQSWPIKEGEGINRIVLLERQFPKSSQVFKIWEAGLDKRHYLLISLGKTWVRFLPSSMINAALRWKAGAGAGHPLAKKASSWHVKDKIKSSHRLAVGTRL